MKRFALFVLLLIIAAAGAGVWLYTGVGRPFKGYDAAEQFVEIPQGAGSIAIAKRLADAGVVRDVSTFRLALWITGEGRRLQAGGDLVDHPPTARRGGDQIARGPLFLPAV